MKKLFAIISLFALVLTSCEKDEIVPTSNSLDTISATIESAADTKAALQNGTNTMNVVWESGDYISIFFKIGDEVENVKYRLSSGEGTTTGTFEKTGNVDLTNAEFLATVYPYTQYAEYDAATKTISGLTMAASYQYNPNKMTTQAPMAYVGSVNSISFKNAASLIQVTTSYVPSDYTSVVLSSTASKLSGNYNISFNNNNEPVATLTGDNSNGSTVTFTGTGADQTIYFPILPDSYSDLAVTLNGTSVVPIELIAPRELVAARNNCYYTSIPVTTMTGTNVNLTNSTTQEDIQILDFTDVTGNITVTGNSVTDKITIVATNEPSTPRELNIELPSATVEVTGSSTYSTITASTAENTLILGNGVNVANVIVNKGNIRVNNGAVLNGIQLGNSVTSVKVIDNGGTIANAVKNTPGVTVITGLEADIAAAEDGETVYMTQDVTLDNILTIDKNITLDGNGFTLTSEIDKLGYSTHRTINVSGVTEVTIRNLIINASESERGINIINNSAKVNIENVTIECNNYAVNLASSAQGVEVNISNSNLTGRNTVNVAAPQAKVTVNNTVINCNDNADESYGAISFNPIAEYAEVTINGGTINVTGDSFGYNSVPDGASIIINTNVEGNTTGKDSYFYIVYGNYQYTFSSFEKALEKAQNGETIILSKNIEIASALKVPAGKDIAFDLNGKTVTAPSTDAIEVLGTLTIRDNKGTGKVQAGTLQSETVAVCAVWAHTNGVVTIEGGHYTVGPDKDNKRNDCIYAGSGSNNSKGTITINGGKFEFVAPDGYVGNTIPTDGDQFLVNAKDGTGSVITINGGEYKNYVPGQDPVGVSEIQLGSGKKVYLKGTSTEVIAAHSGDDTQWYEVK